MYIKEGRQGGRHLALELVHQLLHPLVVLVVLVLGEGQLLDPPLRAPLGLLGLDQAPVLVVKLSLQVLHGHCLQH